MAKGKMIAGIVLIIVGIIFLVIGMKAYGDYSDLKDVYDFGKTARDAAAGLGIDTTALDVALDETEDEMNSKKMVFMIMLILFIVMLLIGIILIVKGKKAGAQEGPPPGEAPPPPPPQY